MSVSREHVHKHITYDDYERDEEEGYDSFTIYWDYENEEVDKIMNRETHYRIGENKQNLMWIEEIKTIANWKKGEEIYIDIKQTGDGCFHCWIRKDRGNNIYPEMIVEKSGYVSRLCFNHYNMDETEDIKYGFYVRVDSYYNDEICRLSNIQHKEPKKIVKKKIKLVIVNEFEK